MRIMIASFILAIAFHKIHRTGRDAALVMGIMAEHLLRGARPTEESGSLDLWLHQDAFRVIETMGIHEFHGCLPATHIPEAMHDGMSPLLS